VPLRLKRAEGSDRGRTLMAEHSVATPGLHRLCVAIGAGPDTQISELLIVTGGP